MHAKATATGSSKAPAPTIHTIVGHEFLAGLAQRNFEALAACFTPDVRFRALVPLGLREASGPQATVECLQRWFGAADPFALASEGVQALGDRLHLAYRITLCEQGCQYLVSQQVYCDLSAGRISGMDLLCSGFLLTEGDAPEPAEVARDAPLPDAELDASGESCATLTPLIRARLRQLASGAVLAVTADDPGARDGVPAWSRLTGNELLATVDDGDGRLQFYLRRK